MAVGAVLRALDKENGPQRITKSSYGFLRTEPYEPLMWKAHAETKPTIDQNDGEKYVVKTIYWLICKVRKRAIKSAMPVPVLTRSE